jgi:hypothetical protein
MAPLSLDRCSAQLGYTILYVTDVLATLKFYEAAFRQTTRFLQGGGDYDELETGSTALAFSAHHLMQQLGKNSQEASPALRLRCARPMWPLHGGAQ